jgi:sialate O-acetylesterase
VGEVWLGSGQSNMAMTVERARDFEQEKAAANLPQIRVFTVAMSRADTAATDCKGEWKICSPETVGRFSATAFFFGRELHKQLHVPVGLIASSVGGTPIESWIDADAQRRAPELQTYLSERETRLAANDKAAEARYQKQLAAWQKEYDAAVAEKKPRPRKPEDPKDLAARKNNVGGLYNGMIAPLIPYTIRGAIWYQGEANSAENRPAYYQYQLSLLVETWRAAWGEGDFPFAWVQLPNFIRTGEGWPRVREAMLKTLRVPNTGMAITIDSGDPKDIHPANKQVVGERLAAWALAEVYGKKIASSGPLPAGSETRGGEIVVSFTHTDGGLTAHGGALKGFQLAGDDRVWHPAQARIDGNTVVVHSADVKQPVAVRYAWADNPDCNLYNGAGLPASPFRTDDWPAIDPQQGK